ncbi:MAG: hypothetical protein AAF266_04245 [Planctomycetota bacterium]
MRNYCIACLTALLLIVACHPANAQLRVVTYNTLDKPFTATDRTQVRTIFDAIATTPRNGIAKRPDIIGLQEQRTTGPGESTASIIADELNLLYGVTTYETLLSGSGNDLVAAVYDSATVSLSSATQVFAGGPRPTRRVEFQPVGYSSDDASLYTYISHLKAGSSSSDRDTRATETDRIRDNADALGPGQNIVYLGDLNMRSFETAYGNLQSPGNGQAFDPLGLGSWPNSGVAIHLTQSTRSTSLADGGASGGLDDRFDLQLVTESLLDGEGLSYIGPTSTGLSGLEHSNQAFGNDGVSYNTRINNTLVGRSQSSTVINALHNFSDHLPVIVDYQLPAVLGFEIDPVPLTLTLGESFDLGVSITNDADVVATAGADELDYTLVSSGDVSGDTSGMLAALSAGDLFNVSLDTSSVGMKSGLLTFATSSQAAENAFVEVPILYEVISALLAADFNGDGTVDLLDLDILGANFGGPGDAMTGDANADGTVDLLDLDILGSQFGQSAATSVPEPTSLVLVAMTVAGLASRRPV